MIRLSTGRAVSSWLRAAVGLELGSKLVVEGSMVGLELGSELLVEGGTGSLLGLWVCDGGFAVMVALWSFFMVVCGGFMVDCGGGIALCSGFLDFFFFFFILRYFKHCKIFFKLFSEMQSNIGKN